MAKNHPPFFFSLSVPLLKGLATSLCMFGTCVIGAVFDANNDYSDTANPNGAWSYGCSANSTLGSAFVAFDTFNADGGGTGNNEWSSSSLGHTPNFRKNTSDSTIFGANPGQVSLHPGPNNEYAILRFTAPAAGSYLIDSQFFAGDTGETDAHVLLNNDTASPLFSAPSTTTNPAFTTTVALQQGDVVDFVVGSLGDHNFDTTPLRVFIQTVAGTAPASRTVAINFDDLTFDAGFGQIGTSYLALGVMFYEGDGDSGNSTGFAMQNGQPVTPTVGPFQPLPNSRPNSLLPAYGSSNDIWVQFYDQQGHRTTANSVTFHNDNEGRPAIIRLQGYDVNGLPIGSYAEDSTGPGGAVTIHAAGIYSAKVYGADTAGSLGLDDFSADILNTAAIPSLTFSATPAGDGEPVTFNATFTTQWSVVVQTSIDSGTTWNPLPDGNGGAMTEGDPVNQPGQYNLVTTFYPSGTSILFRAVASSSGQADVISAALSPLTLRQAALSISLAITSTSDPVHGLVTHIGDDVTYTYTWQNTGNAPATHMNVYTPVPTFRHSPQITLPITTTVGKTTVTMASGATTADLLPGQRLLGHDTRSGATVASITDATHFVMSLPASGTGTYATAFYYDPDVHQFASSDLTYNQYGHYTAATGQNLDASIRWDVADLQPGGSQSVALVVHTAPRVDINQSLGLGNDYKAYSSTFQPPFAATGYTSGAANVSTQVEGPISFTFVPKSTALQPGGLATYTATITNLSSSLVAHAVAAITVPDGMRFGKSYVVGKTTVYGLAVPATGKPSAITETLNFGTAHPEPQLVLSYYPYSLYPRGDRYHRDSIAVDVTFQVQWISPSEVQGHLSTFPVSAAFLDPTGASTFGTAFTAASISRAAKPSNVDFIALLGDTTHETALSMGDNGIVTLPLQGSLAAQPLPSLGALIANDPGSVQDDGQGNDVPQLPLTGADGKAGRVTFVFTATNWGSSVANDVSIQATIPDHTTVYSALLAAFPTSSTTSSRPTFAYTIPPADPHHVVFYGMTLLPHDGLAVQVTFQVDTKNPPAIGSSIDAGAASIGTTSTPHTPEAVYNDGQIAVTGPASFGTPVIYPLVPSPVISTDATATAARLDNLYKTQRKPSALPLLVTTDPTSFIPGVQRFYVQYENTSPAALANVDLEVPVPAHTVFYRASFMSLLVRGNLPGTVLATPVGDKITLPAAGVPVKFHFNQLAKGAQGNVMVEVIVTADAVRQTASNVGGLADPPVVIHDNPTVGSRHSAQSPLPACQVWTPPPGITSVSSTPGLSHVAAAPSGTVPRLGLLKIMPKMVSSIDVFDMTFTVFNYGDTDCTAPHFHFTPPTGAVLANVDIESDYNGRPFDNDPSDADVIWDSIPAHTAVNVNYHFVHTHGVPIGQAPAGIQADYLGTVVADASTPVDYTTAATAPVESDRLTSISGCPLHSFPVAGDYVYLVDIGGGNVVGYGLSSIISGGKELAGDAFQHKICFGSETAVSVVTSTSISNAAFLLGHKFDATGLAGIGAGRPSIVLGQGVDFLVPPTVTGFAIVGAGGGKLVATGGGNTIAQGGGNVIAQGGGNVIAQGGGNVIAQGGGNVTSTSSAGTIAQGGGNVIAAGGGNVIAQGGGNIIASAPGSGLVSTNGGNTIAAGGGNVIAQGGGN